MPFRFRQSSADIDEGQLADRLFAHVDRIAGLIGPRHLGKPSSMEATATYIEREFETLGYSIDRQSYSVGNHTVANLVTEIPGTGQADKIVVVGAHYDTVPSTPGADDNASAVAMLIEAARVLRPHEFRRTLRFVAFPCEEPPHFHTGTMGSQVYARECRNRDDRIVAMLALEMVGYYTTQPNSQKTPPAIPGWLSWAFPRKGNFLAAVGNLRSWSLCWPFRRGFKKASRFPLFSIALPEIVSDIRLSDNSSFWDQGYPALMVTDTSFLRNPHYHMSTDTPDTLDYNRMAQATIGVAGGTARLARVC